MSSLVLGTAGHIDHGKSALVKALTGTDPDRLKEEQARGITIDLGFAHAAIGDLNVAFVDVPGHERFVRNMLAGAGGVDAVLLVVAADESVMPQTREHFAICRLLGIERGVIALTKSDLVDAGTLQHTASDVRDLVAGSFLSGARVVPVSARTGSGLDDLRRAIADLAGGRPRPARADAARLPIDRVFTVKGFGTVVTGTLVSGALAEADELVALPEGRAVRVRGLHVHGQRVDRVLAPSRVAVNVGAISVERLERGVTLATAGTLAVTRHIDARVELLSGTTALRHGATVRVHHGTSAVTGIVSIGAVRTRDGAAWMPVAVGASSVAVAPGGEAYVRIRLDQRAALTRHDRIVLRSVAASATIGGGVVLDPDPPAGGLRRPSGLDRFLQLDAGASDVALAWLREAGHRGLLPDELVRRGGLSSAAARDLLARLAAEGRAIESGGWFVDADRVVAIESRVVEALTEHHRAQPAAAGVPREALRTQLTARAPERLFDLVAARLASRGVVAGTDRLALASHRHAVTEEDARHRAAIERVLRDAGLVPPEGDALAAAAGTPAGQLDRLVRALIAEGRILKAGPLVFHAEVLDQLRREVAALKTEAPRVSAPAANAPMRIDVAWFKTRFGLSRKFAIPLLEYLDRARVTRRVGDTRIVL
jgi:selenocysteine-specific elongation factor